MPAIIIISTRCPNDKFFSVDSSLFPRGGSVIDFGNGPPIFVIRSSGDCLLFFSVSSILCNLSSSFRNFAEFSIASCSSCDKHKNEKQWSQISKLHYSQVQEEVLMHL